MTSRTTPTAAPVYPLPATAPSGMPMRAIDLVVIHCTATPSGQSIARGTPGKPGHLGAAAVVNSWHAVRGFKRTHDARRVYTPHLPSIGYHWLIDLDGAVQPGRHPCEVGAHAALFNARSLGICLVGGAERSAQYTPQQWGALRTLVHAIGVVYNVPLVPPTRHYTMADAYTEEGGICGHRDLSPDKDGDRLVEPFEWLKTCPGFDVSHWLKNGLVPDAANVLPTTQTDTTTGDL
jgi:N-acetylmuramoyl-L-alanine amidase